MANKNQELEEKIRLLMERMERNEDAAHDAEQRFMDQMQEMIQQIQRTESTARDAIQEINMQSRKAHRRWEAQNSLVSAAARDLIRTKWQVRDLLAEQEDESEQQLRCGICGYTAPLSTFETKETDCIFAGGHLKRFICPECGCIFGPTKFSNQTKQELDDDYVVHYAGFHEGDSTHKEKFAFEQLNPVKDGVYLNYGCGKWSHTIADLRAQGFQVYGYEPYAADIDNPYIYTDMNELLKMRFDGIFSNDLLEHLTDPIGELQFMKLLLRTSDSKMAHCTGCFNYKYEYTRFHMFFFTGNSTHILAEKAGLAILGHEDEPQTGDPCYVFGLQDAHIDLLHRMRCTHQEQSNVDIRAGRDATIYGPYLTLPAGEYVFTVRLTLPAGTEGIRCNITSEHGKNILQDLTLYSGYNHICIILDAVQTDMEIIMRNTSPQGDIILEQLTLKPKAIDN